MPSKVLRDELSNSRVRQLLETAPDALVIVNELGLIDYVNAQTETLFGYKRTELIGKPVEMLIPERFRATHGGHRASFVSSPVVRPMGSGRALAGRHKDGSEFAIEVSLSPLHTPRGIVVSAAIRDIRERLRVEMAAQLSAARLMSAVDSILDAFALFGADDRLVLCNSVFRQMFANVYVPAVGESYESIVDSLVERSVFELGAESPAEFRDRRLAYWRDPKGAFEVRTKDLRNLRITDRRTAERGTVTIIRDVTDEVQHAEELRQARAIAEAASAAKTEFLSSMSHELRTPLNAILGFGQLLQLERKAPLNERQKGMVEQVLKAGEHLLRLIDDVLDLARIEMGNVPLSTEPVNVYDVLIEAKTALEPMADRAGIELVIAPIPHQLPMVSADRTRFAQILMNFGSNAIKYNRRGGKALFEAQIRGERVRITVRDTGMGIPEDKQGKIFQPFQRAGQEAGPIEGTGIGLTITKRLTEMMGGNVGFASEAGQGSDFWVELPVPETKAIDAAAVELRELPRSSPLRGQDGPRYTALYVEDNPSNISFMDAFMAEFERVRLVTAPTAEIGIEIARARLPDIILMDINLPGMSGFDALRQLREFPETKAIPVLALSAAAMERDKRRAEQAGFYKYLTKPVRVDELTEVLEELLAGLPTTAPSL